MKVYETKITKIEETPSATSHEGKFPEDIVINLDIFKLKNAKELILTNLFYDGICKTRLSSGEVLISVEESFSSMRIPAKKKVGKRKDTIFDFYLDFKISDVKLSTDFYVLNKNEDSEKIYNELTNLKRNVHPGKLIIKLQNIDISMTIQLKQIDKRFKLLNLQNRKLYNFRRPKFEIDFSLGNFEILEETSPRIKTAMEIEEEDNATIIKNDLKPVGCFNRFLQKKTKSSKKKETLELMRSEVKISNSEKNKEITSNVVDTAENSQGERGNTENKENLECFLVYEPIMRHILKKMQENDFEFRNNFNQFIEKITNYIDRYSSSMRSVYEIKDAMKVAFGYFIPEKNEDEPEPPPFEKREEQFFNSIAEKNGYDYIKYDIDVEESSYTPEDIQKMKIYLDSLTKTSYLPRKYMIDHYEMFSSGIPKFEKPIPSGSKYEKNDAELLQISDITPRYLNSSHEKQKYETLKTAIDKWIKILNLITSFDGLHTLYRKYAFDFCKEKKHKKEMYWDGKIYETKRMKFEARDKNASNKDANTGKYDVFLYFKEILFAGFGLAKITKHSFNMYALSFDKNSGRTDYFYELTLEVKVPFLSINADYYVVSSKDLEKYKTIDQEEIKKCIEDEYHPGIFRTNLEDVRISLVLGAVEIDDKYTTFPRGKKFYFRAPHLKFNYNINDGITTYGEDTPVNKDPGFPHTNVTKTLSKKTILEAVRQIRQMIIFKPNTIADLIYEKVIDKFNASVVQMPSIFEITKIIEFIVNNNPKRQITYYNKEEKNIAEKKFYRIVTERSEAVKFINNALKDARKYFSPRDKQILNLFKESLKKPNESIDELFNAFENRATS